MLVIKQTDSFSWSKENTYKFYMWIGENQGSRLSMEGKIMSGADCYSLSDSKRKEFTTFTYDDRE